MRWWWIVVGFFDSHRSETFFFEILVWKIWGSLRLPTLFLNHYVSQRIDIDHAHGLRICFGGSEIPISPLVAVDTIYRRAVVPWIGSGC